MTAVETPRKATPSIKRTLPWNNENQVAASLNGLQTPQTARTAQEIHTIRTRTRVLESPHARLALKKSKQEKITLASLRAIKQ